MKLVGLELSKDLLKKSLKDKLLSLLINVFNAKALSEKQFSHLNLILCCLGCCENLAQNSGFLWCEWWWCWGQGGVHDSDIKDSPARHTRHCRLLHYYVKYCIAQYILQYILQYTTQCTAEYCPAVCLIYCSAVQCTAHSALHAVSPQCRISHYTALWTLVIICSGHSCSARKLLLQSGGIEKTSLLLFALSWELGHHLLHTYSNLHLPANHPDPFPCTNCNL